MNIFDDLFNEIKRMLEGLSGDFTKRICLSGLDLETCNGEAVGDTLTNACEICVALNKTVFKSNNRPIYTHLQVFSNPNNIIFAYSYI